MTRRQKDNKPVVTTEPALKIVRLELTPEMHHKLRIAAAIENTSMALLARKVMEQYLTSAKVAK